MSQVAFLSYAREDDLKPPYDANADGFVCALHKNLKYEFTRLARPRPDIWQDVENVRGGDLFDPKIAEAINGAALFIAVLSSNWLTSEYCQKELKLFRQRWADEDDATFRRRVIVVHCNFVERDNHPPSLTGQTGFWFFKFADGRKEPGRERFYYRGKTFDDDYLNVIRDLAVYLWQRSREPGIAAACASAPTLDPPADGRLSPDPPGTAMPAKPKVAVNARTIYLAKPGPQLESAYQRIAKELLLQGYDIRPRKDEDLAGGDEAAAVVDQALAQCELSVHLVGTETADDDGAPMTRLQLARAARRARAPESAGARPFRRIVWAPRVLQEVGTDPASRPRTVERDPLAALLAADCFLPSDKVDGGAINDFVIFLLQNLDAAAGAADVVSEAAVEGASDCYIYYDTSDSALARRVARALRDRGVEPILPSRNGDDTLRETLHRQRLQECDAVVLCWGEAPDAWAHSYSHQLRDWKQLGRTKQFKVRGLVVGPPPDEEKEDIEFWPKREIDVVIPITAPDGPSPESLAGLGIGSAA